MISFGNDKNNNTLLKTPKISFREAITWYGFKRAVVFPLLALCFIVIIIGYHYMLRNYARKSISEEGQLNAGHTSQEIELYLASGIDTLERCAYVLNMMEREGASHEEILDYLTQQTDIIQNSVLPTTTGIYACIDGEYLDGSGWDPGPDYDPTKRPWYTQAVADSGKITYVNPYQDLYSDDVIMTLSKNLDDLTCVIAIDIKLDRIQEIISDRSDANDNSSSMVISGDGLVVAHTNKNQIGRNYGILSDTLEHAILDRLAKTGETNFDITFKDRDYTVYAVSMSTGWHCLTIMNSDDVYRPLTRMAVISIAVILATLFIFLLIMYFTGRKDAISKRLSDLLSSAANIYMSLCDLDIINQSVTEVKNVNPVISKAISTIDHNLNEAFLNIMTSLPDSPTKQLAVEFCDLTTINERLRDTDTATIEYLSFGDIWVRARLIVSERTKTGEVSHVLWMLENITKEKIVRDSLIDRSERAVAASEAKSAFLSHMSHEIRTPINTVLGMNEMILRETDDDNIISYSQNIKNAGHSLLVIINDILDFSRIESGKMQIIPSDYEFSSAIADLVSMVKVRIEDKGLEFILDIDPEIPNALCGDEVRVKQVLTNILTNACKYTERGSVTLSVHINKDTNVSVDDKVLLDIKVSDTGIGIKKENLDKLFTEFERFDLKKNRNIEGTGLGMAITKNLLELMGSSLNVESEYGKGSTFSFTLAQTVRDWTPVGNECRSKTADIKKSESYVPKFTASSARVLIVDDTMVNLVVFKGLLSKTLVQIDTAESGKAALNLCEIHKYDLIFLDHMMPGMDGVETLNVLRGREGVNKNTPAICLTANAVAGAKEFYLESGFTNYLTKPINSEQLEEMIYEYLPEELID